MFESFDSERTIEDVLGGILRVRLGGESFVLPVRPISSNRRWVESLDASLGGVMTALGAAGDDVSAIVAALESVGAEQLLDLLISYDEDHVLPPREHLEEITRPHEILAAVMAVRRVQNPLADAGLVAARSAITAMSSPAPTNGSRPPTGGRRRRSKAT